MIFAAGAEMVAVFFTFALSGPLPPKGDGHHLGIAVLLDAALIRLRLLPVLLRLMGRWAWYLPRWAHRVLPEVSLGHTEKHYSTSSIHLAHPRSSGINGGARRALLTHDMPSSE